MGKFGNRRDVNTICDSPKVWIGNKFNGVAFGTS